jgi:putative transposase
MWDARSRLALKFKTRRRVEGECHARALNWSCYRNQPLLELDAACQWLVDRIELARQRHRFDLWAWCIMPTHVHLLIYPGPPGTASPVSEILRSIKLPVAQHAVAWAKRNDRYALACMEHRYPSGAISHRFWQRGGGYDRNLLEPQSILEMINYIHQNPVEEGLCARAADWRWSSAATFDDSSKGVLALNLESLPPIT